MDVSISFIQHHDPMEMSVRKKRGVQTWNQVMHFWSTALSIKSTPMVILARFDKLEVVEATKSD